jgi:HAMP domain-containing protein
MPKFLKAVSVVYLVVIWLIAAVVLVASVSVPQTPPEIRLAVQLVTIGTAIILSVPAAALYAFGQLAGDVRQMRDDARASLNNLRAIRRYYEPEQQQPQREPAFR